MMPHEIVSTTKQRLRSVTAAIMPQALLITRGSPLGRRIALTFDDGPDELTWEYLDELERLRVRATFFVLGDACARHRNELLEIVRRGHEVAVHGYSHRVFPRMSRASICAEIETTADLLPPQEKRPMVRPPHGATSLSSLLTIASMGYSTVLWSVDSDDCRTRAAADVISRLEPAKLSPGDIVLLHEGQRWTLDALEVVVERLRAANFELTTVGEILAP